MGITIITDGKDSFTATKKRFWLQRFTREKISFTLLDTYNYAIQVLIKK